jgi:hypothetical protein
MKRHLIAVLALCLVGCSSPFVGQWQEVGGSGKQPAVLRIDNDGTFAGGARPSPDQPVKWQLTGTWKTQTATTFSLARRDGEVDQVKLVDRDQLLVMSPGTEQTTFHRLP